MNDDRTGRRVLLVGAGPAGISAALWMQTLGVAFRWVDASSLSGGTLHRVHHPIKGVLGVRGDCDGPALAEQLASQLAAEGLEVERRRVERLDPGGRRVQLTGSGEWETFDAIALATGTRPRRLKVPGERELEGRGVYRSTTRYASQLSGRAVVVVGGGDSAYEGALILARAGAARVTLVHRGRRSSARQAFVEAVEARPEIDARLETRIEALEIRMDRLEGVLVSTPEGEMRLPTNALFVKIGVEPRTPPRMEGAADFERGIGGYLLVNEDCETSYPGIHAIGDVRRATSQCVAEAAGDGARLAHALARKQETKDPGGA